MKMLIKTTLKFFKFINWQLPNAVVIHLSKFSKILQTWKIYALYFRRQLGEPWI